MEDSWARDSQSKCYGQHPQQDYPNHGQDPREADSSQKNGVDSACVWARADVANNSAAFIDDAIGQFGNLTLGDGAGPGAIELPRTTATDQVVVGMDSLRVEGDAPLLGVGQGHFPATSQGMGVNDGHRTWGSQQHQRRQQVVAAGRGSFPGAGCPSCGGRGQQGIGMGPGPDGIWRDGQGRRMFTEEEVREAIEQESRSWRIKSAALTAQLANTESEARAALMRADQAMAEMAEKLRMSESKTYALSVHLAKSNRPPHVA